MDPQKPSDPDAEAIDAELKFHFSETVEALVERGWPKQSPGLRPSAALAIASVTGAV